MLRLTKIPLRILGPMTPAMVLTDLASLLTSNKFAALQDGDTSSSVHSKGDNRSVNSKGDRVKFSDDDQALAAHLFDLDWKQAPSKHSKDSAATLAASRARLLGVKIIKKGARGGSRISPKDITTFFNVVALISCKS